MHELLLIVQGLHWHAMMLGLWISCIARDHNVRILYNEVVSTAHVEFESRGVWPLLTVLHLLLQTEVGGATRLAALATSLIVKPANK